MTEEDEDFNRIEREATMRKEAVKATVAKREWVGLTDEELAEFDVDPVEAKALIQKLKEKNK